MKFNVHKSIGADYHHKWHYLIQKPELLVGKKTVDEYIEQYGPERELKFLCVLDANQEN